MPDWKNYKPTPGYRPHNCDEQIADSISGRGWYFAGIFFGGAGFFTAVSVLIDGKAQDRGSALALAFIFGTPAFLSLRGLVRSWFDERRYKSLQKLPLDPNPPPPTQEEKAQQDERRKEEERDNERKRRDQAERDAVRESKMHLTPIGHLSDEERSHHVWIPGVPGSGKTSLMRWFAIWDILDGTPTKHGGVFGKKYLEDLKDFKFSGTTKGVTIIDPAGDFVPGLLPWIPAARVNDTIYFDFNNPIPIDFLSCDQSDPHAKRRVVTSLLSLFVHFSERTGSQMGKVMENILYPLLYTLVEATDVSFLDIYHFLENKERQAEILAQPQISEENKQHWKNTRLNIQETGPITRLLAPLVFDPVLKVVFGCRHANCPNPPHKMLKLSDVLLHKKILLMDLNGADPKDATPKILASLVVSRLIQAAMSQKVPEPERIYHMLYIDEFPQLYLSSDLKDIFSQLRKFHLCLTLANQWFDQIDESVFSGLLTVANWYIFKLNFKDAALFKQAGMRVKEKELQEDERPLAKALKAANPSFVHYDVVDVTNPLDVGELTRLDKYRAVHRRTAPTVQRIYTPEHDFLSGLPPNNAGAESIKMRTLEQYACHPGQIAVADAGFSGNDQPSSTGPFNVNEGKTSGPRDPS